MIAERNPQVGKAVVKFKEFSADERTRDLYERCEKARRDIDMHKRWAAKKTLFEVAKNMLEVILPLDQIIKKTGLTSEEIESLHSEN